MRSAGLTENVSPTVVLCFGGLLSLGSHTGQETRSDECSEGGSLGDYSGLDELRGVNGRGVLVG